MARTTQAPTPQRILDAAQRLFEAQGYNGTGVAEILRESQANAGSLYHYFSSKEKLLLAVLERHKEHLGDVLYAIERRSGASSERLSALLQMYRTTLRTSRFCRGCPVGDLALEVSAASPRVRKEVAKYFEQWCAGVQRWLQGSETPAARAKAEKDARLLLSVVQGALMQARALRSLAPFDASISQLPALLSNEPSGAAAPRR